MLVGESLRVFQGAFEDEPGDGVDIHGGDFAAQAHGFQRTGTTSGKRVEYFGRTPAIGFTNFVAEPLQIWAGFASPVQDAALGLDADLFLDASTGEFFGFDTLVDMSCQFL